MNLNIVPLLKLIVLIQVCYMLITCKVHERVLIQQKFMLLIRNLIIITNVHGKLGRCKYKVRFFWFFYFLWCFTLLILLLFSLWFFNLDLVQYLDFFWFLLDFCLIFSLFDLIDAIFLTIILLAIFRSYFLCV